MPRRLVHNLAFRVRCLVRRWQSSQQGVAAIEFAFIVPIMFVMFVGAVEMSQVITVDRRVTQVASSTADLVARAEKQISPAEITDILRIGGYILEPYTQNPLRIVLRSVVSSPANASIAKQSWSCQYSGTGQAQTCTCSNTAYTLPANLVSTNDSVVVAEVSYDYTPLVFDYFMKGSASAGTGTYLLSETSFLKPRGQAAMLLQENNTPCPSPTF